jgi:cytochrome c peroxidase
LASSPSSSRPSSCSRAFGGGDQRGLDAQLTQRLQELGYTGRIASTLPLRLGRPLNPRLANIGRLLWFDTITGLNDDNTCAGCHSPTNGFGDSQPTSAQPTPPATSAPPPRIDTA